MTPERRQQANEIYLRALELEADDRTRFTAEACAGDDELFGVVELLLATVEQPDAQTVATRMLTDEARTAGNDPTEPDTDILVGTVIDGSYRIERLLGRGGMGAVYLAEHVLLRDRVALKLLPPEFAASAERLKRFLHEGRASRALRHPNVVAVHEMRVPKDGPAYMVLEYVEGHTLTDEIRRLGRFRLAEALAILEPVAAALDHAHANGLVHRDLKPDNIMVAEVDGSAVVKLLDLGIAKLLDVGDAERGLATNLTMPGQILGTPAYMSPEQWGEIPRDGGTEIDGRTDVYSLAVVAYEMLAGHRPYRERTLQELRRAHVRFEIPTLVGVPPVSAAAIARALSKDRADRQETAGEFVVELKRGLAATNPLDTDFSEAATQQMVLEEVAPTVASETVSGMRTPFARTAVLGVALASLVGVGSYWIWARDGGDVQRTEVEAPPAEPAPPVAQLRTLDYSIIARRVRNGRIDEEGLSSPEGIVFREGDKVRVLVTCPQDGFLYVINEWPVPDAATGLTPYTVLFPSPSANGGSPRVAANSTVRILEKGWISFGGARGFERLWIVWSTRGLEELVNPGSSGRITEPARVEAVRAVLGLYRVSAPGVEKDAEGNRTTLRGQGDLLVHPLEFEHQ